MPRRPGFRKTTLKGSRSSMRSVRNRRRWRRSAVSLWTSPATGNGTLPIESRTHQQHSHAASTALAVEDWETLGPSQRRQVLDTPKQQAEPSKLPKITSYMSLRVAIIGLVLGDPSAARTLGRTRTLLLTIGTICPVVRDVIPQDDRVGMLKRRSCRSDSIDLLWRTSCPLRVDANSQGNRVIFWLSLVSSSLTRAETQAGQAGGGLPPL
jgi:hypothetical protein